MLLCDDDLQIHVRDVRHTLATEILGRGATMPDVADVLGIDEHITRRHYAKWSAACQERISEIMRRVFTGRPERTQQQATIQ